MSCSHSEFSGARVDLGLIGSLERYDIDLDAQFDDILGRYPRKPWSRFITSGAS